MDRSKLQAALVDYKIGNPENLNKPVTYIMMGDGLWEIRRTLAGDIRRRIAKAEVPGLSCNLEEGIELRVPRIPFSLLGQAVSFFRDVYYLHKAEAILHIVWNQRSGKHELICPHQRVSGGRVDFEREPLPSHLVLMADIHSHCSMSAYFSSTDDSDEKADMFYMVVGKVDRLMPELAIRLRAGGEDVPVEECDVLSPSEIRMDSPFPAEWMDRVKKLRQPRSTRKRMSERQLELAQMMYSRKDLIEMGVIDEEDDLSFFKREQETDEDPDDGWPDSWRM